MGFPKCHETKTSELKYTGLPGFSHSNSNAFLRVVVSGRAHLNVRGLEERFSDLRE
jgi:hypothetical protein